MWGRGRQTRRFFRDDEWLGDALLGRLRGRRARRDLAIWATLAIAAPAIGWGLGTLFSP
jgi:hypothetical protein